MSVRISWFKISHGSTVRHLLLRALVITSALSGISLVQILPGIEKGLVNQLADGECLSNLSCWAVSLFSGTILFSNRFLESFLGKIGSDMCKEPVNLTSAVVRELMGLQLLNADAKALCIGCGSDSAVSALRELGFSDIHGVCRHPFFSFKHKKLVYVLGFEDKLFDFALSGDLRQVNSPALLVLEMERVLKPGGTGCVLVSSTTGSNSYNRVKSATAVSSLLKESTVVYVGNVDEYDLVVFRRKITEKAYLNLSKAHCESNRRTKPYMEFLEPIVDDKPANSSQRITYLPTLMDMSTKKRLVLIDIGASEHLNTSFSSGWFLPSYPIDSKAFNIYFVDHNTSVMLSYVKKPGINFVYHPGLAGNSHRYASNDLEPFPEDDEFDFLAWFEETVKNADFVVMRMNANEEELKLLSGLFKSHAICSVDELFLSCSNSSDCMEIFGNLRSSGVFVHQWWGVV